MNHARNSIACAIVVLTRARKFFGGKCLARGQSHTAANRFLDEVIQTDAVFDIHFEMAVASVSFSSRSAPETIAGDGICTDDPPLLISFFDALSATANAV